jgi:hypothetical protein
MGKLVHKHNGFDPGFSFFPLPGSLTHEQLHQVSHLHLGEILTMTTFQKILQTSIEETAVRPDKQRGQPLRNPFITFLQKFHRTVGRIHAEPARNQLCRHSRVSSNGYSGGYYGI